MKKKEDASAGAPAGSELKSAALRPPAPWQGRLADRGQIVGYLIIVIAVLIAINVVASQHDHSWDLTKNHLHSLSPESVKIVRDLHQPLHLIYFDRSQEFPHAKQFLDRYQRESNRVDLQFVDPDRHPEMARRYGIQNYGTTVVAVGGRQQLVTNLTEQDITNALVRVLKGARKVVYFTLGEGERDPSDTGRNGYSDLKTALESENFTVKTLILAQTPQVPADCAVLVVAGPTHSFVQPEVDAINKYLQAGGRALFLLNIEAHGPLVDYLQTTFDVKMTPDVVVDTSGIGRLFGASELMPIVAQYDPHDITSQMNRVATIFPFARTVAVADNKTSAAVVSPLVETTPSSYATTDFANGQVRVDPKTAEKGPLTLGVAGTLTGDAANGRAAVARFVIYGSPDIASNAILGFGGNRDLVLNSMNWLSTQEAFITIRPQQPQNTPINLSAAQMNGIRWAVLVILPVIIILCGLGMWWRRRSA